MATPDSRDDSDLRRLPAAGEKRKHIRRIAWLLFAALSTLYCLLGQGTITAYDEGSMLEVTKSLVRGGRFDVPPAVGKMGRNGRYFSQYGIGQSMAAVPFYVVGLAAGRLAARKGLPASRVADAVVSFFNCFVTGATVGVVFLFAHELGTSAKMSVACALTYGLATLALPYAKFFYSDPLCALLLLCAALHMVRMETMHERTSAVRRALWIGVFLGLAMLVRIAAAVPALVFVGVLLLRNGLRPNALGRNLATTAACVGPLLAAAALIGGYNAWRFGSPTDSGYRGVGFDTPLWYGLYVLLLSPGRSLFLHSPVVILGAIAFPRLVRHRPFAGWLLLVASAAQVLFFAAFRYPEGGWSYGPRLLLPVVGFFTLPLALELGYWAGRLPTLAAAGLVATSALVQLPAVWVHPSRHTYELAAQDPDGFFWRTIHRPADAHVFALWRDVRDVTCNAVHDVARLKTMAAHQLRGQHAPSSHGGQAVLGSRVVLNAPNFWWLTSYYAGVPAAAIVAAAAVLAVACVAFAWLLARQMRIVERTAPRSRAHETQRHHAGVQRGCNGP